MAVRKIITAPNKVLKTKTSKISKFDNETKELAQDLLDTVLSAKNPEGAGLAAPQIGVPKRVCVVRQFIMDKGNPELSTSIEHLLINPKLTSKSTEKEVDWEACLSIPNTYAQIQRHKKIKLVAFNELGEKIQLNASGFFARVIQHELDHLDGILITDKAIGRILSDTEFENMFKEV